MKPEPGYLIIRYYFLGLWQIGGPLVLRAGSISPEVIGAFAKHGLPWVFRWLFSAVALPSEELPPEYLQFLATKPHRKWPVV